MLNMRLSVKNAASCHAPLMTLEKIIFLLVKKAAFGVYCSVAPTLNLVKVLVHQNYKKTYFLPSF